MRNYSITNDIARATHFLAYPDPTSCVQDWIIPNKEYEIIEQNEQYFIRGEDGLLSTYFDCHKGDFIIKKGN